ncbi:site-specific DNA-methyltransferase [Candidatus Binatia bacterium]|nr:site-specific DNA-methyltransferase [Candidatus Binatia bacterium]
MARAPKKPKPEKKVTRYTYDDIKEPRTPETGHTSLLPADEQVVTLPMDNGWSKAVLVGKLPEGDDRPVVVDMDPAADPVLFWAGKRNRREVPVLPLQRNEIVSESRIAQIIERAKKAAEEKPAPDRQGHLFADLEKTLRESDKKKRVEFYTHEEGWKNKLICGDSLHVMESLLHYENLRGKVQMIYVDPPYGIKYDSNFQQRVDSTKNDEKDQADDILTIKAFRDTWALGIHSYLSYLRERLYLCRELLTLSGSIFVQINDDNVHLVRTLMDEVFGATNHFATIVFNKTTGFTDRRMSGVYDCLVWYARDAEQIKYRQLYQPKAIGLEGAGVYTKVQLPDGTRRRLSAEELKGIDRLPAGWRVFRLGDLGSQGEAKEPQPFEFEGKTYYPAANSHWKAKVEGLKRLAEKRRIEVSGNSLGYVRFYEDFPVSPIANIWLDTGTGSFTEPKVYAVQTGTKVVLRCVAMATDPGDLIFDPTCGSGTTAHCAERLGRRWITCDTSRVAVNVARQRLISGTFDHFKTRNGKVSGNFLYRTVDRVTLKSLAYDLEPEKVALVDQPDVDNDAIRVCGPFEVASLGRYSIEDWKGYVFRDTGTSEEAKLENYIEVICRLYRKGAAIQGASGLVHAVAENEKDNIAISVGPLSGRVTAKQINDAVQDALASGILEVHVLGWAFEANVGEVKSALEKRGKVKVELIMIRPDTLAEGLKATQPEMLFSPLALPDIEIETGKSGREKQLRVTLNGVALFDRKRRTTEYKAADSGYVSAWYLDEDYDGDCFVDCQMFFDFKKTPNIKAALKAEVDPEEFTLKLTSEPFPVRDYKRVAVKVVDVYGNESVVVRDLA